MKIVVIAANYDGTTVNEFDELAEAEEFCSDFVRKYTDYGLRLTAVQGRLLEIHPKTTIQTVALL